MKILLKYHSENTLLLSKYTFFVQKKNEKYNSTIRAGSREGGTGARAPPQKNLTMRKIKRVELLVNWPIRFDAALFDPFPLLYGPLSGKPADK